MMVAMNCFHEPLNVEKMMGCVKPEVEDKQVNKGLLKHLEEGELVLSALPVAIEWSIGLNLPNP